MCVSERERERERERDLDVRDDVPIRATKCMRMSSCLLSPLLWMHPSASKKVSSRART